MGLWLWSMMLYIIIPTAPVKSPLFVKSSLKVGPKTSRKEPPDSVMARDSESTTGRGFQIVLSRSSRPKSHRKQRIECLRSEEEEYGWVGLIYPNKCTGPGTKGFASICLSFFVLNLHKMAQGSFDLRPELHAKNIFWAPQRGFGNAVLYTKT
jgi:hypothetical protein